MWSIYIATYLILEARLRLQDVPDGRHELLQKGRPLLVRGEERAAHRGEEDDALQRRRGRGGLRVCVCSYVNNSNS